MHIFNKAFRVLKNRKEKKKDESLSVYWLSAMHTLDEIYNEIGLLLDLKKQNKQKQFLQSCFPFLISMQFSFIVVHFGGRQYHNIKEYCHAIVG